MGAIAKERKENGKSRGWYVYINHNGSRKAMKMRNKTEALETEKKINKRIRENKFSLKTAKPLKHYCELYKKGKLLERKASTQRGYLSAIKNHIATSNLYNNSVDDISILDVENFLTEKRKTLTRSSCVDIKAALSNVFKIALKDRAITTNPCQGAEIPTVGKESKTMPEPYDQEEINQLLDAFKGNRYYAFVMFLCYTGCRVGEACALQWSDIDLEGRTAHICKNINGRQIVDSTKSGKPREVDLRHALVEELRKLKRQTYFKGKHVFLNSKNHFICSDVFRRIHWKQVIEKNGLRWVNVHSLRHSYVSILLQESRNYVYVSQQVGHTDVAFTMNRYGHVLKKKGKTRIVDMLDQAVN